MGKASRRKKDTVERRDLERRCLHCGAPRDLGATVVWCSRCRRAALRAAVHWPIFKWPITDAQRHWLLYEFWGKDPRFRWPMNIDEDEGEDDGG
jgi:hypothetical protein